MTLVSRNKAMLGSYGIIKFDSARRMKLPKILNSQVARRRRESSKPGVVINHDTRGRLQ